MSVGILGIADEEGAAEAVGVLASVVGVIPVGTGLLDLFMCQPWQVIRWTLRWSLR